MSTQPKCTGGLRHAWQWEHNVSHTVIRSREASMTLRGRYRCAHCGATKLGAPEIPTPEEASHA